MSEFYDEMQGIASELLTEFNQGTITYVAMTAGGGPADEPGEPIETVTVFSGAVVRGVQFKYVRGSTVLSTDLQVTIPGGIVEPTPEGFFTADGVRLKIVEVHRIPATGTAVAYTIIVRK